MASNRLSRQGTIMLDLPGLCLPKPEDARVNAPPPPYQAAAPPTARASPRQAPAAHAPIAAPRAGAPTGALEDPEFGEVEHIVTTTAETTVSGHPATLFFDRFHIAGYSWTLAMPPPPPPPVIARSAEAEARSLNFCAQRLDPISAELIDVVVGWANRPDLQAVWIRLTADDRQGASCDAAFLVNSTVLTPYEMHPSVAKQSELFRALHRPWFNNIVHNGTVGVDYPSDIVFKNDLGTGDTMSLAGINWVPHTGKVAGWRKPWIDALKAEMAATLRLPGSTGSSAHEIAAQNRPDVAALGQTPLRFMGLAGEPLHERAASFAQREESTLRGIVEDILAWPATRGRKERLGVNLLHFKEKGSTVQVGFFDSSNNLISEPSSAAHDPNSPQEKVARRWADLCRQGPLESHHPALLLVAAWPEGGTTVAEVAIKVIWPETMVMVLMSGMVADVYGMRPGDNVESLPVTAASPPANAASPPRSNAVTNSPRTSIVSSPPASSPPLANALANLSLASPPLPNVARPVSSICSPPLPYTTSPPLAPALPPAWTGGTLPPFRYQGIGGLILEEPTTSFLTRAKADIGAMLAYIIDWPPTMRQIELISVVLVHIRGRGASARVELTDVMGNNITTYTSMAYTSWGLLQQVVAQRWAELCRRGSPGVDHPEMLALTATPKSTQTVNVVSAAACWEQAAEELASAVERTYEQRAGIPVDFAAAPTPSMPPPPPVRAATAPAPDPAPAPYRAPVRAPTAPTPIPAHPSMQSPTLPASRAASTTATPPAQLTATSPTTPASSAGTGSWINPMVSFVGIPWDVPHESTPSFLRRHRSNLYNAMREIMTWPPTLGRIDGCHVYLVHTRSKGSTVNVKLLDASGAEITLSASPGHQNARVLLDRVAGHWAAICRAGLLEIDRPPLLLLVSIPAEGELREVFTRAEWVEAAMSKPARTAVAETYAARPGDEIDGRASSGGRQGPYVPAIDDMRAGLAVRAPENAAKVRSVTFMNSFAWQALKMVDLALSWKPRQLMGVPGTVMVLVDSGGKRASLALVNGRNGERLERGESQKGQPPTVLQNGIGQLWDEAWARRQASTHHPPVIVVVTQGDINPEIMTAWNDQECLSLLGYTIHELYENLSAYSLGRMGTELPHIPAFCKSGSF